MVTTDEFGASQPDEVDAKRASVFPQHLQIAVWIPAVKPLFLGMEIPKLMVFKNVMMECQQLNEQKQDPAEPY